MNNTAAFKISRGTRRACPPSFNREFDAFLFGARHEFVSLDDPRASVPAEQGVVIAGRPYFLRLLEPVHGFLEKIVGLIPAVRGVLRQLGLGAPFRENPRVVGAIIFALDAS